MNNFYDKLLNIKGNNIEDEIQKAILETKHYYNELTTERTCFIYSSKIFEILLILKIEAIFLKKIKIFGFFLLKMA